MQKFYKILLMWTILKSLLNLLQYCFRLFVFWAARHADIISPIELAVPALEVQVLTTGPPGRNPM